MYLRWFALLPNFKGSYIIILGLEEYSERESPEIL